MFPKTVFVAIVALALVSMACGISINVPADQITAGETQTMPILVSTPESGEVNLTLEFGAGELRLAPGATGAVVMGAATYNIEKFKPVITVNGANVRISTGDLSVDRFPFFHKEDIVNEWDLKLGSQPLDLTINAGAYQGDAELGGLALTNLEINDGAAEAAVRFSQPNPAAMERLVYTTGASQVSLRSLANANFANMTFRGGAGQYTLDFSGQLTRDARVNIESGVSQVILIIPQGVAAQVAFEGGLSNVNTSGAWQQSGGVYTQTGSGPQLTITVSMGAGELQLRNTP